MADIRYEAMSNGFPQLASGIEFLGKYDGSGLKDPPYLVRRPDGQMLRLSRLLYLVAQSIDGRRSCGDIATIVTEQFGRSVTEANVSFLIEEKLRPLGLLGGGLSRASPATGHGSELLRLNARVAVVPPSVVRAVTERLAPLFRSAAVVLVILAWFALDAWLVVAEGLRTVDLGMQEVLSEPVLILMVLGVTVASGFIHELGHATACHRGGAKPGAIGIGMYLLWPAFFNDVTDAYRLRKVDRLRTDLGGIYFNGVLIVATTVIYLLTEFEPLLVVVAIEHLGILWQLLPFVHLDGYYVLSDLIGVPDLFARIKPIARSFVPGRTEASVAELRPGARVAVSLWVLVTVPVLLVSFSLLTLRAPSYLATSWESFTATARGLSDAVGRREVDAAVVSIGGLILLAVPTAGMTLLFARVVARGSRWILGWVSAHSASSRAGSSRGLDHVRDPLPTRRGDAGALAANIHREPRTDPHRRRPQSKAQGHQGGRLVPLAVLLTVLVLLWSRRRRSPVG